MTWCRNLGENICRCIFYTLCCPCILCVCVGRMTCCPNLLRHSTERVERDRVRTNKRLERGRDARIVRPLGPVRKRELSTDATARADQQKASPLLNKLPAEIRLIIWNYVLGGQRYHLMQIPRRLGHHICGDPRTSDPGRACCFPAIAYWRHEVGTVSHQDFVDRYPTDSIPAVGSTGPKSMWAKRNPHALSLLRTCQRVYRETIDIPYRGNDFDIDDPEILLSLRQTIPRPRFKAIRSLRILLESKYAPFSGMNPPPWFHRFDGLWTLMWHTISYDMIGLKKLELFIQSGTIFPEWPRDDDSWRRPMKDVRGLNHFNLTMREGRLEFTEECDDFVKAVVTGLREVMYQPRVSSPTFPGPPFNGQRAPHLQRLERVHLGT